MLSLVTLFKERSKKFTLPSTNIRQEMKLCNACIEIILGEVFDGELVFLERDRLHAVEVPDPAKGEVQVAGEEEEVVDGSLIGGGGGGDECVCEHEAGRG